LPGVLQTQDLAQDTLTLLGLSALPHQRLLLLLIEVVVLLGIYSVARGVLGRLTRRIADRLTTDDGAHRARTRTLVSLLHSVLSFVLGFVLLVSLLSLFGVNIAAIVGTASVAGLAFGFGAQKLVKDVITGFFILLEDQYAVGDYVTIGAVSGTVQELGMRITRIRDDDGRLYILSNGDIATICNQSRGTIAGSFEVAISAAASTADAIFAMEARLAPLSESLELATPARVEGIVSADAAKTVLKVGFHAPIGRRPGAFLMPLREAAVEALRSAQIPLG
jgi:small conductance mechanosensitive channel